MYPGNLWTGLGVSYTAVPVLWTGDISAQSLFQLSYSGCLEFGQVRRTGARLSVEELPRELPTALHM
jgi:hypothetical protein